MLGYGIGVVHVGAGATDDSHAFLLHIDQTGLAMRPSGDKAFPFWAMLACTLLMLTNAQIGFNQLGVVLRRMRRMRRVR
jgi:hypothetical protein